MRIIVLISLVFLICNSCKKEKDLGPLYSSFIGKWVSIDVNHNAYFEFKKSGNFSYSSGVDRNRFFVVVDVENINPININNSSWAGLRIKGKKTEEYKSFYFNEMKDTIFAFDDLIDDSNGNFDITIVSKLYFTIK